MAHGPNMKTTPCGKDVRMSSPHVVFISAENREYAELWEQYGSLPLPSRIHTVMLMGSPHFQQRNAGIMSGYALARLDMELRMVDALRDGGYEVVYKVHPGRVHEASGIFEDKTFVMGGNIKDNLHRADAFVCPSITTTAFSYTLCTNKPIITLDLNFQLYTPFAEPMESFKKRCRIIRSWIDERNRIMFDDNALLAALIEKPRRPDTEFVRRYMIPGEDANTEKAI